MKGFWQAWNKSKTRFRSADFSFIFQICAKIMRSQWKFYFECMIDIFKIAGNPGEQKCDWCDLSIIHFWSERHLKGFGWNSLRSESKTNAVWGSWFNLYRRLCFLLPTFNEFHNLQNPVFFCNHNQSGGWENKDLHHS